MIEIGAIDSLLRAREALQRGEIIGILADRGPGGEKTDHVGFLGSPAPLPTGPMVLAGVLGVPALLFFGLRTGPRRYQVRIEAFADRVALRRETRQADLHRWLARYADRVAANCRDYPYNWFNFFDFWGEAQKCAGQDYGGCCRGCWRSPRPPRSRLIRSSSGSWGCCRRSAGSASVARGSSKKRPWRPSTAGWSPAAASTGYRPTIWSSARCKPHPEDLVADGNRLTMTEGDEAARVIDLASQPEIRALVDTVRATLSGDARLLQFYYAIELAGDDQAWELTLHPVAPQVVATVREVMITGHGSDPLSIETIQTNGDTHAPDDRTAALSIRPIALALAAAGLLLALVFWRIDLRADMADFLPQGQTPAARLMLQQLRSGTAASLILIGLEGAPEAELGRISRSMTAALQRSGRFALVQDGRAVARRGCRGFPVRPPLSALPGHDRRSVWRRRAARRPAASAARAAIRRISAGVALRTGRSAGRCAGRGEGLDWRQPHPAAGRGVVRARAPTRPDRRAHPRRRHGRAGAGCGGRRDRRRLPAGEAGSRTAAAGRRAGLCAGGGAQHQPRRAPALHRLDPADRGTAAVALPARSGWWPRSPCRCC